MNVELNRVEAELQHEESALYTELSRLAEVSGELGARLAALSQTGQALNELGLVDRARAQPPTVDVDGAFANARVAREAAVKLRRDTNAAIRQQLADTKAKLQQLTRQVLADELLAKQLEVNVREAEALARQRAAAPPPPAPPSPSPPQPAVPPALQAKAPAKPQRQRPRVRMQAEVDFQSDDNFFNGFSANISDGGLFVATTSLVPLGTEVDLAFTLPSGARIETKGVVRWVREVNDKLPEAFPGLGVQFKHLEPTAQAAIDQFLAEREPLFYAE